MQTIMHPADRKLIFLRSHLSTMSLATWLECYRGILGFMQATDPNGDWTSFEAQADLASDDGLEYVASVVHEWCADAGL